MFRPSQVLAGIFLIPILGYCLWKWPKGSDPLSSTTEVSECPQLLRDYRDFVDVEMASSTDSVLQASHDFTTLVEIKYLEEKRGLRKKCNKFFKDHPPKKGEEALYDEARRIEALAFFYNIRT